MLIFVPGKFIGRRQSTMVSIVTAIRVLSSPKISKTDFRHKVFYEGLFYSFS